jgi:glycosyltransferase involved in cell wall biosynthesis
MTKIAIVTTWHTGVSGGSGTAVFFHSLCDGLRQRGYSLDIIAPDFNIPDYIDMTLQRFLFNTELRTNPRVNAADVVIGFDYDGYGLDPQTRPPMIASIHALYKDVLPWESDPIKTIVLVQAFFDKIAMDRADHITIGSDYAKQRIVDLYEIAPEKISVINHGMIESASTWLPLVDATPRVENDHPVILAVGKFYPRKRVDVMLRAVALLKEQYPRLNLRIVGDGLDWDKLHTLADELQLGDTITWLGTITDDAEFAREWRQADIFCHPSSQETFGFVYLEAMKLGKPIVAARAGAAPEVVADAGILVEPENPAAFADGLRQLIESPQQRKQLGEIGRQRAQRYTHANMIDGYEATIERIIRQRKDQLDRR